MEKAEHAGNDGCPPRDNTECEGYVGARSAVESETGETGSKQPGLPEKILPKDNLNNAYKRVKTNKGSPGVDGMTVEAALPWLKEHGKELTESIRQGKNKPDLVRRKEIPKPDGGVWKLGYQASGTESRSKQSLSFLNCVRQATILVENSALFSDLFQICKETQEISLLQKSEYSYIIKIGFWPYGDGRRVVI